MLSILYRKLNGGDLPSDTKSMDSQTVAAIPANFFRYTGSLFLTRLGDALVNPKTTLVWLAGVLGAPTWVNGLLVPIRESGSMILQLAINPFLQRLERRKWAWVAGSVGQAVAVCGLAATAFALDGMIAGAAILACTAAFAFCRSLSSLSSKDVLGRTQPRRRRGRVTGWASSAAGIVTLLTALAAFALAPDEMAAGGYGLLLLAASGLWLLAATLFSTIAEPCIEPNGDRAFSGLRALRDDAVLQRFVAVRGLLLCSALSTPYVVTLAQRAGNGGLGSLAIFIGLGGLAGLLGGPVWGYLSDLSSRRVLIAASAAAALLALTVALLQWRGVVGSTGDWLLPAAYFIFAVIHEGVRVARKTYVVDIASGDQRTDYVAASNTAIGVLLLVIGGLSAALAHWSIEAALVLLGVLGIVGSLLAVSLPEVDKSAAD